MSMLQLSLCFLAAVHLSSSQAPNGALTFPVALSNVASSETVGQILAAVNQLQTTVSGLPSSVDNSQVLSRLDRTDTALEQLAAAVARLETGGSALRSSVSSLQSASSQLQSDVDDIQTAVAARGKLKSQERVIY